MQLHGEGVKIDLMNLENLILQYRKTCMHCGIVQNHHQSDYMCFICQNIKCVMY